MCGTEYRQRLITHPGIIPVHQGLASLNRQESAIFCRSTAPVRTIMDIDCIFKYFNDLCLSEGQHIYPFLTDVRHQTGILKALW